MKFIKNEAGLFAVSDTVSWVTNGQADYYVWEKGLAQRAKTLFTREAIIRGLRK
jgi:hypothetical protein